MGIKISRAHDLMESSMNYRAARQDMIAGNIANADTPFYRPRDIRFEEVLEQKSASLFADKGQTLSMSRTDGSNSVDLDVETTEMAKNSTMFNALTAALKKDSAIFRSVIDASGKTS